MSTPSNKTSILVKAKTQRVSNSQKLQNFRECIAVLKTKNPDDQPLALKDFSIGIQIGAGAFALVKRAVHKDTQHTIALKTYEKRHLSDKHA
jgi:LEA14-like dessication related protein